MVPIPNMNSSVNWPLWLAIQLYICVLATPCLAAILNIYPFLFAVTISDMPKQVSALPQSSLDSHHYANRVWMKRE